MNHLKEAMQSPPISTCSGPKSKTMAVIRACSRIADTPEVLALNELRPAIAGRDDWRTRGIGVCLACDALPWRSRMLLPPETKRAQPLPAGPFRNLVEPSGIEPLTSTMPSADDGNETNGLVEQSAAKRRTADQ